ncbi:hypothetical protein Tco_0163116 [Tanacetum coccineum]
MSFGYHIPGATFKCLYCKAHSVLMAFKLLADVSVNISCKNSGLLLMFTIDYVGNKKFVDPPLESEIIIFLASLGHTGDIRKLSDVNVNKLHQPWRSFAAVINKCLCGTPSYDSLRLSQAQILWGMYNRKNVDYAYLLWEDFIFKIETNVSKRQCDISDDDISWKSSDDDQDDEQDQDDDDAEKHEVHETTQEEEDDDEHDDDENDQEDDDASDDDKKAEDDDDEEMTESDNDGDDFVHPKLTTHEDEIIHEKDTDEDDSSISSSDEDDSDNDVEGAKVTSAKSGEDATDAKDQGNEAVKDSNTDLDGRDKSSSVSSGFVSNMLNPNQDTGVDDIFRQHTEATSLIDTQVTAITESVETISQIQQTNQYADALSSIPGTVDQYLANKMQEAVNVAVQLKYDRFREESTSAQSTLSCTIAD